MPRLFNLRISKAGAFECLPTETSRVLWNNYHIIAELSGTTHGDVNWFQHSLYWKQRPYQRVNRIAGLIGSGNTGKWHLSFAMTPWPILSCVVAAREQIKLTSLHLVINVGKPTSCNPTRSFRCRLGTIESAQSVSQSVTHSVVQLCRTMDMPKSIFIASSTFLCQCQTSIVQFTVCLSVSISFSLWSSYLLPNHYHEIFHENVCPVPLYVHYLSFSISFDYCRTSTSRRPIQPNFIAAGHRRLPNNERSLLDCSTTAPMTMMRMRGIDRGIRNRKIIRDTIK